MQGFFCGEGQHLAELRNSSGDLKMSAFEMNCTRGCGLEILPR
jgi:hypothetical protein